MRTQFDNRWYAASCYRHYRKTWDRQASWTLTLRHCASDPVKRLAAAITLAAYRVPQDGIYIEVRR